MNRLQGSRGERLAWLAFAALMLGLPLVCRSSLALTLLAQTGIAIVACLSFNILLGQGGMLSFGHAVYSGLGAFAAVHALRAAAAGSLWWPVSLMPLLGGAAGAAVALPLGFISTRRAGTSFAMITLGLGELVFALAAMAPGWFGGEAGLSANRVIGPPLWGISFGPQIEVSLLLAVYTLVCAAAMRAFMFTPLGCLLAAVRDNAERVDFIGHDPRRVRALAAVVAGFFAGVAGGMFALNAEVATPELLGTTRSASVLLFTVLGGAGLFAGPVIGAVLMVAVTVLLPRVTEAWLLYLGLAFMLTVVFTPGGLAQAGASGLRRRRGRPWRRSVGEGLVLALAALPMCSGLAALVEMLYRWRQRDALGPVVDVFGVGLDVGRAATWVMVVLLMLVGAALFVPLRRHVAQRGIAAPGARLR